MMPGVPDHMAGERVLVSPKALPEWGGVCFPATSLRRLEGEVGRGGKEKSTRMIRY